MLIVVIPAILMAVGFTWKYRASNKDAKYSPNWSHSIKWKPWSGQLPILIIIFLAVLTGNTHALEPNKPLAHDENRSPSKWFPWTGNGSSSIRSRVSPPSTIAFPANTPVYFKVTSNSVMNSFFIPRLGSQIYAMAGMQTRLHLIANEPGTYDGISASHSGPGFSGMKFKAIATKDRAEFDQWVAKAKQSPNTMNDMAAFEKVAMPSEYNKVNISPA